MKGRKLAPEQATEQAEKWKLAAEEMPSSQRIEEPPAPSIAEEQPAPEPEDTSEEIPASPAAERPLRFVWTMDADERFNLAAPTFADAMGPRTSDAIGKPWREIAAELGLDAEGHFANAVAARDTFSGIVLAWPGASGPVSVELSGLPIFDRERTFKGYRGFGVCRDGERDGTEGTGCTARRSSARSARASRAAEGAGASDPHDRAGGEERGAVSERRRQTPCPFAGRALGLRGDRRDLEERLARACHGCTSCTCAAAGARRAARAAGGRHRTDTERLRDARA